MLSAIEHYLLLKRTSPSLESNLGLLVQHVSTSPTEIPGLQLSIKGCGCTLISSTIFAKRITILTLCLLFLDKF